MVEVDRGRVKKVDDDSMILMRSVAGGGSS